MKFASLVLGCLMSLAFSAVAFAQNAPPREIMKLKVAFSIAKCVSSDKPGDAGPCLQTPTEEKVVTLVLDNCHSGNDFQFCSGEWRIEQSLDGYNFSAELVSAHFTSGPKSMYQISAMISPEVSSQDLSSQIGIQLKKNALTDTVVLNSKPLLFKDKATTTAYFAVMSIAAAD